MGDSLLDKFGSRFNGFNLPPFISNLQNTPRYKFEKGEISQYLFFWASMGAIAGMGAGSFAFWRKYRYIKWVRKQPQAVQLKILEKNNMASHPGIAPQIASTKFSTIPNAMDTRIKLPFSSDYKPYQWYEMGPLKLWNNLGYYPWASEGFVTIGTWSVRITLLTAATLTFESGLCLLFGYPLGTNIFIRGMSGSTTGYILAKIASEGYFYWYEQIGMALGLGALWMLATWYDPNWGEISKKNKFVMELYSSSLHKAVQKHFAAKTKINELYVKDLKDKHELYQEFLLEKQEQQDIDNDDEDDDDKSSWSWLDRAKFGIIGFHPRFARQSKEEFKEWLDAQGIEISKEIEDMPYEERKKLEQETIGSSMAINYDKWPFKALKKHQPQWLLLNKDNIQSKSDSAIIADSLTQHNDNINQIDDDLLTDSDQTDDLSILS